MALNEFCEYGDICTACDITVDEFEKHKCIRRPSLISLFKNSHLPKYQWDNISLIPADEDIEAFTKLAEIRDNIKERVQTPGSKNLIICSQHMGNGKTSWAIKMMQRYFSLIARKAYMDEKIHGVFVPTSQYVLGAKDFSYGSAFHKHEELRDAADKADIVIWDDIGAAEYTRYDYINLLVPIDRRVFAGKFNIFTTNFTKYEELVDRLGERLANRIWATSEIIELKGVGARQ